MKIVPHDVVDIRVDLEEAGDLIPKGPFVYEIDAARGAFILTGFAALVQYWREAIDYEIDAEPGAYSLVGIAAGISAGRPFDVDPGVFSFLGFLVNLSAGRPVDAAPAGFTYAGGPAEFVTARNWSAALGAFSFLGDTATLDVVQAARTPVSAGTFDGPVPLVGAPWVIAAGEWSAPGLDEYRFYRDGEPIGDWQLSPLYYLTRDDLGTEITAANRRNGGSPQVADGSAVVLPICTYVHIMSGGTNANTRAIGTHEPGDVIVGMALRGGSSTPPTFDASVGWDLLATYGSAAQSCLLMAKVAQSDEELFGVHTNATRVISWVYRPSRALLNHIGAFGRSTFPNATVAVWTALSLFQNRNSLVLAAMARSGDAALVGRSDSISFGAAGLSLRYLAQRMDDPVAAYLAQNVEIGVNGSGHSIAVELVGWDEFGDD